jgi:hypothetical protein
MGLIRTVLVGAAVAYGIQYLTKKREDGSSILSDLMNNPPDFVNDAKNYATQAVSNITQDLKGKIPL